MKISVFIADSRRLFAHALGEALDLRPDLEVIGEHPTTGSEAVEAVLSLRPEVALLDYWMTSMEGPAVCARILARLPAAKIILLSWFHGTREVNNALNSGAVGFLPRTLTVEDVAEAIRWAQRQSELSRRKPDGLNAPPGTFKQQSGSFRIP